MKANAQKAPTLNVFDELTMNEIGQNFVGGRVGSFEDALLGERLPSAIEVDTNDETG